MTRSTSSRSIDLARFLVTCLAFGPGPALAIKLGEDVQVHGFVSQGMVHTGDNNFGGNSDDSLAFDMREMGVNISWRPDPDWLLSAQVVTRWAGQTDDGSPRLDYGFLDRTLLSAENRLGIQIGKIKRPYGLFNVTRDVAHTRPGVLLPQSIYLDLIRNFVLAAPGASVYGGHEWPAASLSWHASLMRPEVDDRDLTQFMIGVDKGNFSGETSWNGQVFFDWDGGRWRAGLTLGNIAMQYHPVPGTTFSPMAQNYLAGESKLDTKVLSLEKNTEQWTVSVEYAQVAVSSKGFSPGNFLPLEEDNTVEAYYAQLQWRFSPGWQAYARMDTLYLDKDDRDGRKLAALVSLPNHSRYAHDRTIGLRRDIGNWALFAELHKVDGTAWLSAHDNPGTKARKWDMLLFEASYRF